MSEKKKFENDNLTVVVTKKPGCKVNFDVSITPKASEVAFKKAIKVVNKEVSLPGFRKGKAPDAMVIENFGKYVDQEFNDILINTGFQEALKLSELYPLSQEVIKSPKVKKVDRKDGSEFSIEFEQQPEIPDINFSEIELKKIDQRKIKKEDIENQIESLRLHHAKWEDITDRGVKEGDYVDLDVENLDKKGEKLANNMRFLAAKGEMGEWMRKLIVGLKIGESAEGLSEKDPSIDDKNFKPTKCKITVKGIKIPEKPEINDEFLTKLGVKTEEELREKVKQDLENQEDYRIKTELGEQIEKNLLDNYPFEVPESLTAHEKNHRLTHEIRDLKDQEKDPEKLGEKEKELEEKISQEINGRYRLFFLFQKIANENKILVEQNEIMQELMQQMYMNSPDENIIDASMEPSEVRSKLYMKILERKVKYFLIDRAKIS